MMLNKDILKSLWFIGFNITQKKNTKFILRTSEISNELKEAEDELMDLK